ncbi:MAG: response regulator transcription factor [Anaerolineae bacterium]|nr:response regulator transcription factor [Anaerolineae bacterium]
MINVFLVEDNRFVADAVDGLLGTYDDIRLVGVAATGEEALTHLPAAGVDIVLIDLALPGMNGIDLIAALRRARPELPCVILSAHREDNYITQALAAGARGYITKELPLAIAEGIERVVTGEVYLSPDLVR